MSDAPDPLLDAPAASGADGAVIKTAGRVFEVLEYMREQRRAITVRDVSESLGYPKSSTLVLLKSMAALGYLRYDLQQRAFFGTIRLATLGDWVLDTGYQGGRLLDIVDKINRDTHETSILAVENDIYAQYVHVILSGRAIQFNVQPGTRRLLAMSGLGWALLSQHSDADVERVIHKTNLRMARGNQKVSPTDVMRRVSEAREQGFAFSRNTVTEGIGIIALPLVHRESQDAGERLAVGVGGFVDRLDQSRDLIVARIREHIAAVGA